MLLKKIAKEFVPPIIWTGLKKLKRKPEFYGFYGDFSSWSEVETVVKDNGFGYDTDLIFKKVCYAIQEVRKGCAVFERDSVLFFKEEYNYSLLAALFFVFSNKKKLDVIDFGGALGSTYFQNRKLFSDLDVKWTVIEQKNFVGYGKTEVPEVDFAESIDTSMAEKANCLLLSSFLQYVDNPYHYLEQFLSYNVPYIVIDRAPLIEGRDRLVLQRVPADIYDATYPAWLLSKDKFIQFISQRYDLVCTWDCISDCLPWKNSSGEEGLFFTGMLFRLK